MLTYNQAIEIAKNEIVDEHIIIESSTIEKEYGWVFFYNSRKFFETGDINHTLAGNCPILIEKKTGDVYLLPTYLSVENGLAEYEKRRERR